MTNIWVFWGKSQENEPLAQKWQYRKSKRTRQKNKRGDRKGELNDSPKIPDMGEYIIYPACQQGESIDLISFAESIMDHCSGKSDLIYFRVAFLHLGLNTILSRQSFQICKMSPELNLTGSFIRLQIICTCGHLSHALLVTPGTGACAPLVAYSCTVCW